MVAFKQPIATDRWLELQIARPQWSPKREGNAKRLVGIRTPVVVPESPEHAELPGASVPR